MPHSTAQTDVYLKNHDFTGPGLPSHPASQLFFSLYDDRQRKWQFGVPKFRDQANDRVIPSLLRRTATIGALGCLPKYLKLVD